MLRGHLLTLDTTSPPASPPSGKGPSATHSAASNLTSRTAAAPDSPVTIGSAAEAPEP
jgi:hypothetical protein